MSKPFVGQLIFLCVVDKGSQLLHLGVITEVTNGMVTRWSPWNDIPKSKPLPPHFSVSLFDKRMNWSKLAAYLKKRTPTGDVCFFDVDVMKNFIGRHLDQSGSNVHPLFHSKTVKQWRKS